MIEEEKTPLMVTESSQSPPKKANSLFARRKRSSSNVRKPVSKQNSDTERLKIPSFDHKFSMVKKKSTPKF